MNPHLINEKIIVKAVHGTAELKKDFDFEFGLAGYLLSSYGKDRLIELYSRFSNGPGEIDFLMRKAIWRAVARSFGSSVKIGAGVGFKHLETFDIGDSVNIGDHAYIQGRFDGKCSFGHHVWIGPQSFLDARNLVIEDYVGWGPGAKVLGSEHIGTPANIPIITTDLEIKPVRICKWADVGTNAVILPGVTVGTGSIVGAGSVVREDVPPFAIVAGVPARFIRWREGREKAMEELGINES